MDVSLHNPETGGRAVSTVVWFTVCTGLVRSEYARKCEEQ